MSIASAISRCLILDRRDKEEKRQDSGQYSVKSNDITSKLIRQNLNEIYANKTNWEIIGEKETKTNLFIKEKEKREDGREMEVL